MNHAHDTATKMLTSYRAIPAMYRVMLGTATEETKAELSKLLKVNPRNVYSFLSQYKNQIIYAMQDFRHYVDLIGDIPTFEEAYWPAMAEEAKLAKNLAPFKIPWEKPVILDIGAGLAPYIDNFLAVNESFIHYIMVDKREDVLKRKAVIGARYSYFVGDYTDITLEKLEANHWSPNVLLLANFLHCVEDIDAFFVHILPCLPNLKLIKILEIKPDCNLDYLFDYHMFEHCKGQRFDITSIDHMFENCRVESLGDYHNMYTIEL